MFYAFKGETAESLRLAAASLTVLALFS